MSAAVDISIPRDAATPAVQHVLNTCRTETLTKIVGPPCVDLTQKHLGAYKNRKGWPSTGFGEELADKTYFAPTSEGPLIVIHGQGARQLYRGGHIPRTPYANGKRLLVFAIAAESYGKRPAEMGYRPVKQGGDAATNKRIRALFAWVDQGKGVNQPPHPELIPSPESYARTGIHAVSEAIRGGLV